MKKHLFTSKIIQEIIEQDGIDEFMLMAWAAIIEEKQNCGSLESQQQFEKAAEALYQFNVKFGVNKDIK